MKKELLAALFESALIFKRVAGALRPQYVRQLGTMTRGVNEAGAEDVRRMGEIFGLQPARIAKSQRRGSAFMWGGLVLALCNSAPAAMYTYNYSVHQAIPDNGNGQLTGTWQADGRSDPLSSSRGSLTDFNGLNPNGTWTLFFADQSPE